MGATIMRVWQRYFHESYVKAYKVSRGSSFGVTIIEGWQKCSHGICNHERMADISHGFYNQAWLADINP
jgi:hypothetical protein